MKRYDLLTPEGTRDQLFDECLAKRTIQEKLRKIFTAYGYSEVITPGLEFYDVFNSKTRYFPPETMYKLVDGKNRLMVMRPDNTMPIARLAATRLREEKLPLKLYYNQSIFMVNPKNSGRDDDLPRAALRSSAASVLPLITRRCPWLRRRFSQSTRTSRWRSARAVYSRRLWRILTSRRTSPSRYTPSLKARTSRR